MQTKLTNKPLLRDVILDAILDIKGHDITCLNLREINESIADEFIICHGTSTTQVAAIADNIQKKSKELAQEIPYRVEGERNAVWIIVDFVDIVVHIFHEETRQFYQLEDLWSDAPTERLTEEMLISKLKAQKEKEPKKRTTKTKKKDE